MSTYNKDKPCQSLKIWSDQDLTKELIDFGVSIYYQYNQDLIKGESSASGCGETRTSDVKYNYSMPEGMEGCKVYFLESQISRDIYVVRCPLTTTTSESHSCGKNCTQHNDITTDNF